MAALQYYLTTAALGWMSAHGVQLTNDGEAELHNLLALAEAKAAARPNFARGVVPFGTSDLSEVETNLQRILDKARQDAGGKPIDAKTLQEARFSLCPIFPFC
jgi:hypothetical protein